MYLFEIRFYKNIYRFICYFLSFFQICHVYIKKFLENQKKVAFCLVISGRSFGEMFYYISINKIVLRKFLLSVAII